MKNVSDEMCREKQNLQSDVLSTVHRSKELFHQPTLMQNFLYSLTNILLMNKENCALKLVDEIIQILQFIFNKFFFFRKWCR